MPDREPPLSSPEAGPKGTVTLSARGSGLASTRAQLEALSRLDLSGTRGGGAFRTCVGAPLKPARLEVFQINLGKLCNMTCRHCHVDAGPDKVRENMDRATVEDCLRALEQTEAHTVDLTGGAPELNDHFRYLVDEARRRGRKVMDRCNLTVLLLPRCQDLPQWLSEREVEVVCSLPHYRRPSTDAQRGQGTYDKSLEALRRLNAAGYGQGDPRRRLTLVSNPAGAFLAGDQSSLEREWKRGLEREHGLSFDRLIALNNMPISRFLEWLVETGNLQAYMERLVNAFNPATVEGLMCRSTLSVGWDGRVFDCDFNQMLDLDGRYPGGEAAHIRDLDPRRWAERDVMTARHCFGCTAGAGSSCGGSLA